MLDSTLAHALHLLRFAQDHSATAWTNIDGSITIEVPWFSSKTDTSGVERKVVRTMRELRNVLGY